MTSRGITQVTKAKAIVASIASYIAGYLDSDWELLVIVENKDGERFWSGKGRLRNEFAHGRKVENRSWGMYEVKDEDVQDADDVNDDDDENDDVNPPHSRATTPDNWSSRSERSPARRSGVVQSDSTMTLPDLMSIKLPPSNASSTFSFSRDKELPTGRQSRRQHNSRPRCPRCHRRGHSTKDCLGKGGLQERSLPDNSSTTCPSPSFRTSGFHDDYTCKDLEKGNKSSLLFGYFGGGARYDDEVENDRKYRIKRNADPELPREAGRGGRKSPTTRDERKKEEPKGKRARIDPKSRIGPKSRIERDSREGRNQRTKPLSRIEDDPICFNCHRRGHTKSDCPRDESQRRTRDADKREFSLSHRILLGLAGHRKPWKP